MGFIHRQHTHTHTHSRQCAFRRCTDPEGGTLRLFDWQINICISNASLNRIFVWAFHVNKQFKSMKRWRNFHIKWMKITLKNDLLGTYLNITVKMCKDVDKGGNQFKPNNVNGGKQMWRGQGREERRRECGEQSPNHRADVSAKETNKDSKLLTKYFDLPLSLATVL